MKIQQVAAQLFTIRDFTKTPADVAVSLKKIKAIGYEAVQVSGMGPIDEAELVKIAQGEGLVICATHEKSETILAEPEKVVERLKKLNCRYTAYPSPAGYDLSQAEDVTDLIQKLNRAGEVLHRAGLVLAYHNHGFEFIKTNGKTALDRIYDETNPLYLQGEPDTYWVQYGGGNPVEWCEKLKGRLPLIHLKDYMFTKEKTPYFCEIGRGTLNFKEIIAAAEKSGCEWFIVEQDRCPGDPFASLKISFDYIKANLCS